MGSDFGYSIWNWNHLPPISYVVSILTLTSNAPLFLSTLHSRCIYKHLNSCLFNALFPPYLSLEILNFEQIAQKNTMKYSEYAKTVGPVTNMATWPKATSLSNLCNFAIVLKIKNQTSILLLAISLKILSMFMWLSTSRGSGVTKAPWAHMNISVCPPPVISKH